jgi:hypothetical protein
MAGYKHNYRIFNIIFGLIIIGIYCLLEFFIIPEYVEDDKKDTVSRYTAYSMTGLLAFLGVGSLIADHYDDVSAIKTRR